jgi:predicted  nucleic acid-binding Zn-ribbon protein
MTDELHQADIAQITLELMREMRNSMKALASEISDFRKEARQSFDELKTHDYAHHSEIAHLRERVARMEEDIQRLNMAHGINQEH